VLLTAQIQTLVKERRELLKSAQDEGSVCARKLFQLRGRGENASWLFALELFAWREFKNRREIGGLTELTPTPYQSATNNASRA
jgi:transposase